MQGEEGESSATTKPKPKRAIGMRMTDEFLDKVVKMWNTTCARQLPKLIDIKGSRKEKFRLRLEELGTDKTEEDWLAWLQDLFGKCMAAQFLIGLNNTGWKVSFDWLVANDVNWRKVMEGNYDGTPDLGFDTGVMLHNRDPHEYDGEEEFWNS